MMIKVIALSFRLAILGCALLWNFVALAGDGRMSISLNGTWQIDESVSATEIPKAFGHTVPVPGMANLSQPPFPDVDLFASREYLLRMVATERLGRVYPVGGPEILPPSAPLPTVGISLQKRNYFWYQTFFTARTKKEVALLKISKAQFGTAVWINGKKAGEHLSCWTAGHFDLTDAINWEGKNRLVVRIGAHPAVLPESLPGGGTLSGKTKWTPGIYDDVTLFLCDNPVIDTVQVAPRINPSEVIIQTKVKNYGSRKAFELCHRIRTWKDGRQVAQSAAQSIQLDAGETRTFTQTIPIPQARLWSPDDPFLYVVESSTGGDSIQTRFGMREFRFDSATRRGYLNGKALFLRGGNIELNSFLEDPECGSLPWDRAWVRKLVGTIPKRLNWNAFRFCLSVVPEMWLDIADEEGMLIQYEPPLWKCHAEWNTNEMIKEFGRWMRDNWNHTSVFMWDTSNETLSPELVTIVKAVRSLDLSDRAWDNSHNPPDAANDPHEVHPYLLNLGNFDLRRLNSLAIPLRERGKKKLWLTSGHACIINEYAWLWLWSDGTPLTSPKRVYDKAMPNSTAAERMEYRWYLTGALTEMWRAHRCAAAVLFYSYFGSYLVRNSPGPYGYGAFEDVAALRLQPGFEYYMTEAFKPLGVYINFWGDGTPNPLETAATDQWAPIQGGSKHRFSVVMINDDSEPVEGKLILSIQSQERTTLANREMQFHLAGLGRAVYEMDLPVPETPGKYLLNAVAYPQGTRHKSPTVSRRKISIQPVVSADGARNAKAVEQKRSRNAGQSGGCNRNNMTAWGIPTTRSDLSGCPDERSI